MARVYKRDNRGRFASTGGGSGGRPAAKRVQRGTNRLTRDNAGRIQGVGGSGATARGGRLRTAGGNQRATQLDRLKGRIGGTVSRSGKVKARPVGWAQSPAARADRVSGAKDRSREARLLKSLPKETRRAVRLARKTSANPLGARYRNSINEGATTLRSNFGKRKGLTPGAAESISKAMQHSARKLRAAVAEPRPGQRLRSGGPGRRTLPGDRIKATGRPGGTVAKPRGLKPDGNAAVKLATNQRLRARAAARSTAAAVQSGVAQARRLTQKERWAKRAELRRQQADRADARGQAIYGRNRKPGDIAFWTQPGLGKQRDKARAAIGRAFEEMNKAERLRQRAANLERMANTNKGDAERRRQVKRDAFKGAKGDRISSPLWGPGTIVRVNQKTITYMTDAGYKQNIDKSWATLIK